VPGTPGGGADGISGPGIGGRGSGRGTGCCGEGSGCGVGDGAGVGSGDGDGAGGIGAGAAAVSREPQGVAAVTCTPSKLPAADSPTQRPRTRLAGA
jgi:hypothetical protein